MMTAQRFVRSLLIVGIVTAGFGVLTAPETFGAPNPSSLLTNPLNRHNMSNWATHGGIQAADPPSGTDQICIFCHTPHGAAAVGPLWARTDRSDINSAFPLYGQNLAIKDSYGAGLKAATQYYQTGESGAPMGHVYPNGSSRLCMSCHDGVTAIGLLRDGTSIAMTGNLNNGALDASLASVIDLSTSHPISFIYTDAIAASIDTAYDGQFGAGNYFQGPTAFTANTPLDSQSRIQCTTCHDPHYDITLDGAYSSLPPFWQSTAGYNAVCNNCHISAPIGAPPLHDLP